MTLCEIESHGKTMRFGRSEKGVTSVPVFSTILLHSFPGDQFHVTEVAHVGVSIKIYIKRRTSEISGNRNFWEESSLNLAEVNN